MRSRFSLPVVVLILTLAVVIGTALTALTAAAVLDTHRLHTTPLATLGAFLTPVVSVFVLGGLAGVLGWLALFLLGRDGFHRMERVALLPFNYGGRSPFDTSWWPR